MHRRLSSTRTGGFTFVEMLVSISLSAVFLGAANLVYSSISANSKRLTEVVTVEIGQAANTGFYNQTDTSIRVYQAPSFGRSALAQNFRDLLLEDTAAAAGVYCLPRLVANTIRPEFLTIPASSLSPARPLLDTPEAFRQFLATAAPASTAIYDSAIRNTPAGNRPNASIFLLAPETSPGAIRVLAVYEIDFVTPTGLTGSYATVRRYQNGALTHFYDVYYPPGPEPGFTPLFVAFERSSRAAVNEGTAIDRFKLAPGSPFYFVALPDPAVNPFRSPSTAAPASTTPAAAYAALGSKTSLLVVLPQFPNL